MVAVASTGVAVVPGNVPIILEGSPIVAVVSDDHHKSEIVSPVVSEIKTLLLMVPELETSVVEPLTSVPLTTSVLAASNSVVASLKSNLYLTLYSPVSPTMKSVGAM